MLAALGGTHSSDVLPRAAPVRSLDAAQRAGLGEAAWGQVGAGGGDGGWGDWAANY
jgi:hypothetical protein